MVKKLDLDKKLSKLYGEPPDGFHMIISRFMINDAIRIIERKIEELIKEVNNGNGRYGLRG